MLRTLRRWPVVVAVAAIVVGTVTVTSADAQDRQVSAVDGATAAAGTGLAFDLPAQSVLKASPRKVFAHYFPAYPVSIDNKTAASDYYSVHYLTPNGENGKHKAYGGLLRDRPLTRAPLGGDWKLEDMKTEVRQADNAGLDGFTVDLMSVDPANAGYQRVTALIRAAEQVDPRFSIALMPDMAALSTVDVKTLAKTLATLAASRSVHRLADGRVIVAPFYAEKRTLAFWNQFLSIMQTTHGLRVALVPTVVDSGTLPGLAQVSYGWSNWGARNPRFNVNLNRNIDAAHAAGKIWMQPVSVQDERPRSGVFDEANNTENLRVTWQAAIDLGADWVQIPTWNDYSEGAQIAPSTSHGYTYLDLVSWYLVKYKTGAYPKVRRDAVVVTHRVQKAAAKPSQQTTPMTLRPGSTPARDTVEVLSLLPAPATVTVIVGGNRTSWTAPAGLSTRTVPLVPGAVTAHVSHGYTVTARLASPYRVTTTRATQDLQYYAVSSMR